MTSIQSQPPARADEHAANQTANQTAKTVRSAGKGGRTAAGPDAGAAFSSIFTASQRKLQADRFAVTADAEADETDHAKSRLDDDSEDDDGACAAAQPAPAARNDGAQGQAGQGGGIALPAPFSAPIRAGAEESPDWLSLASLLPEGADDGVFEVTMPNSAKVGVAVSDQPAGVSYLLMPADDLLASRLRSHEMELAGYLARRIRRSVRVTVL